MAARRLRWAALGLGAALLAWLPVEDTHVWGATTFASLICGLAGVWVYVRYRAASPGGPRSFLTGSLGVGGLAGLAVSPTALALMALKTGAHSHPVADFTAEQITSVLARTPIFLAGGLLVGLGLGLWLLARRQH